jgi:RNA polymerase sigma factor (sigma-70 family)
MRAPLLFLNRDARILELIRRGDDEGLMELFQSSRNPITAFVTRNSGTRDDAEDMLQEALIVLWERVRSGQFEYAAKLETFVFATVRNLWLRRLARLRRQSTSEFDVESNPSADPSPLDRMIESEEAARIRDALERLGEPCRKLLLLFYWEELPMDEIARALGFANAETAKSKKYQCKKLLQQMLTNSGWRHE